VVIVLILGKVKVSQPNLTKTHDDRRFSQRLLLHHYAGHDLKPQLTDSISRGLAWHRNWMVLYPLC
jgi:hypothetical protein